MDYDYLKYKKILILDDEADLREMVTSILEQDGFKTIKTAGTVAEDVYKRQPCNGAYRNAARDRTRRIT